MTQHYVVDHWFLWPDGKVQHRVYGNDDVGIAAKRISACTANRKTTKIVLSMRQRPGHPTSLKVWTFCPESTGQTGWSERISVEDILSGLENERPSPGGEYPGHTQQVLF